MAIRTAALLLLALGGHLADARSLNGITPKLRPTSDEKFMKDDLPSDERPPTNGLSFEHPYPVIQESKTYDSDYVKDENDDNGEWQVQMDYDRLRSQMHKEHADVAAAKKEMDAEKRDLDKAKEVEEKAEKIAEDAEATATKQKGEVADHAREVEDLKGSTGAASSEVEREMVELEECKKELQAAKDRLAELLAKKAAAGGAAPDPAPAAVVAGADAEIDEEGLEKKVVEEKAEWDAAKAKLAEEQAELQDIKDRLAAAEARLRAYRRNPEYVDQDGGVYRTKTKAKSGASQVSTAALVTALAIAAVGFAA